MVAQKKQNSMRGQSLIEILVGIVVLMIVALGLLDLTALVVAFKVNDELAKKAAKVAATQDSVVHANAAVDQVEESFHFTDFIRRPESGELLEIASFEQSPNGGVLVNSNITVRLPAPLPFLNSEYTISSQASEPIVAIPAANEPA